MNQAMKSVVDTIPKDSEDYSMIQNICRNVVDENVTKSAVGKWSAFKKIILKVIYCLIGFGMHSNKSVAFNEVIFFSLLSRSLCTET